MDADEGSRRRLKFYGTGDFATYWQAEQVVAILEQYDPSDAPDTITDVIELHNVQLFAEHNLFPRDLAEDQRAAYKIRARSLRQVVGRFFNGINEANVATTIVDVDFPYNDDLLQLLVQYKVHERCDPETLLTVLEQARVWLHEILTSKGIVRTCDQELRARLLSDRRNAEHVIRHYLERETRREIYLPPSLTDADKHTLINEYLDAEDANPNFIELVGQARVSLVSGIDAKTKLKAQRKHAQWTKEFFEKNSGIPTGCQVSIVPDQTEPVDGSVDGLIIKMSYSGRWLEENLDYPTILNNFIYLFEFTNRRMVLTLPAYQAQFGVLERVATTTGRDAYVLSSSFRQHEELSLLQVATYSQMLHSKDIDLESVIAWFCSDYLKDEFGALNFRYAPSSRASTYLEKCKHVFSELEGVVKQFALYVKEGEIDPGLLAVAYEQLRYREVPSLLGGKYVYMTTDRTVNAIMHLLFSDQSGLAYVDETLQAASAARLFIDNEVPYERLEDYQKRDVDFLITHGILRNNGQRVTIADVGKFLVLRDIFDFQAASYYHYPPETRAAIDQMVDTGWLERRTSFLTDSEASYINYCLNAEYSNGLDLRNKYLHGTYDATAGEAEYSRVYFTAVKLLIALVIKINDEFWLRDGEATPRQSSE